MANRSVFTTESTGPTATTTNDAGGRAYALSARAALAQCVLTGTFNATFYVSGEDQVANLRAYCDKVADAEYVAKLAIYAREHGKMKDAPAFLVAWLAAHDRTGTMFVAAFRRVIDNGKMLSNFVQIIRSGAVGRKSLGSRPKHLVESWFDCRTDDVVFKQSVGVSNPSLADIVRMVHPKPNTPSRRALYGYLSGRNRETNAVNTSDLPGIVQAVERFRLSPSDAEIPDVPWLLLTSLPLEKRHWTQIARNAGWHALRMNLNTFARHGVWEDPETVAFCARKLGDADAVRKSKVFPYQLLAAYINRNDSVPAALVSALHDALEVSIENIPAIDGHVVVCPDVSGSMSSPITGHRVGATTKMRCIDIAALVAAAIMRKNPRAEVIPFEQTIVTTSRLRLDPRDSVMTNAMKLASIGGGGTNCSAPLVELNRRGVAPDLVVFVSDNESWVDSTGRNQYYGRGMTGTSTMQEWSKIARRNPRAKMACIDIAPNGTSQAPEGGNILNVGGFSDDVFDVLAAFVGGELDPSHLVARVEGVVID